MYFKIIITTTTNVWVSVCVCRWETLPCTWKCSLFRMDFLHQHWKQREASWETTSDCRLTSSMLKSKCKPIERERDPVYTKSDWTDYEGDAPVLSCCCISHSERGERRTTVAGSFVISTTWRCHSHLKRGEVQSCQQNTYQTFHKPCYSSVMTIKWTTPMP